MRLTVVLKNIEQEVKGTVCGYYANIPNPYSILLMRLGKTFWWCGYVQWVTCLMRQHLKMIYLSSGARRL